MCDGIQAVGIRQRQIEQNDVELALLQMFHGVAEPPGMDDLKRTAAGFGEGLTQETDVAFVVLDEQYRGRGWHATRP